MSVLRRYDTQVPQDLIRHLTRERFVSTKRSARVGESLSGTTTLEWYVESVVVGVSK